MMIWRRCLWQRLLCRRRWWWWRPYSVGMVEGNGVCVYLTFRDGSLM